MGHVVHFYDRAEELVANVGRFLASALHADGVAIVVARAAHLEAFSARLRAEGIDLASRQASGDLVAFDAAEALATLMVDGRPDRERFETVIGAHAGSSFTVTVTWRAERVRISVRDASRVPPARRAAHGYDSSGRGMTLVAGIALDWASEVSADGKAVWAELAG